MQIGWSSAALPAAVGVMLAGCSGPSVPQAIEASLGPGWNCLATPSAFDGPGVIFRVTPEGIKFTVTDLSPRAGLQRASWVAPTATQMVTVGADVIAQLISVPVSANLSAKESYTVRESFGSAEQVNTTDDGVEGVLNEFYSRPSLDPAQRYYLVRRAITARSVKYDFDKDISASFGVGLPAKIATIDAKAAYTRDSGFHYDSTFDAPQNVCIVAQLLPVPRPSIAVASAPPPRTPDGVPLFTKNGGRDR